MAMLRHMIGIRKDIDLAGEPWRNHYAVSVGTVDEAALQALASEGLVRAGRLINDGKLRYFHATEAGIERAREGERARRRAAGLRRWIVSYPTDEGSGTASHTVLAKSRGEARWDVTLDMLDAGAEKLWCFRNIRVHVADRAVARG